MRDRGQTKSRRSGDTENKSRRSGDTENKSNTLRDTAIGAFSSKTNIPIHSWPSDCRPREKLMHAGAESLSDAELLALFIRCGNQQESAIDLARRLLTQSNGLRGLLALPWSQAKRLHGLGIARFCELQGALELSRRWLLAEAANKDLVSDFASAKALIQATLQDKAMEIFVCLSLDSRLQMLGLDEIARGSDQEITLSPRAVVLQALARKARGVIVAHNHPSGHDQASEADLRFTRDLKAALESVGIALHDHLLIGSSAAISFRERGWM
jgi:DNA repair protein RadC